MVFIDMQQLNEFERKGWIKFEFDQHLEHWAKTANSEINLKLRNKEFLQNGLTCQGTWFVGVEALENDPDGSLNGVPLRGPFKSLMESYKTCTLHLAQVSIIFQGYPKPRGQESQSSFNFRLKRDAAHVDGLIAETPGGPRRLKEPHAYVLGIPINQAPENASPMVVWEGSHHLMSSAFKRFFSNQNLSEWENLDIREIYFETRKEVFRKCKRIVLHANVGESYMIHRHCLHGISPWDPKTVSFSEGRKIVYFRPELEKLADWPNL